MYFSACLLTSINTFTSMNPHTLALIEAARAKHAARLQASNQAVVPRPNADKQTVVSALVDAINKDMTIDKTETAETPLLDTVKLAAKVSFNAKQRQAIETALQAKSFALIGAAGTGKTTVTREIITQLQQSSHVSPFTDATKYLTKEAPGIVVLGFTNKAVNNIKKSLPPHIAKHCITIHKLLEYAPVYYETIGDEGLPKTTMRFEPTFNATNKLPHISTIIIEEASMVGTDLYGEIIAALPRPQQTQIIFLGDLNQLPPVFGPSILGFKLNELPVVELDHVYRQALESPIISLATSVRLNLTKYGRAGALQDGQQYLPHNLNEMAKIDKGEHGIVTLHPWKKRVDSDNAIAMMKKFLPTLISTGKLDPEADMILCPFNKSFGTVELNKIIADYLAKQRNSIVWEVRARYELTYWAVGDRVMVDRHEAKIIEIKPTIGYGGKPTRNESVTLDRWGFDPKSDTPQESKLTAEQIMNMLDTLGGQDDDSKNLASHTIVVEITDTGEKRNLSTAGEINQMTFGYALTVHKSQGSEWQRVFLFLHNSHAKGSLMSRELLYTAITRAKHELYIICEGDSEKYTNSIARAAERPVIAGTTLAEKAEWFKGKAQAMRNLVTED